MITDLITPLDEMDIEIIEINKFLQEKPKEDINIVQERGGDIVVYLARVNKLLADAKYHKDVKLNSVFIDELGKVIGSAISIKNKYINTVTSRENHTIALLTGLAKSLEETNKWNVSLYARLKNEYMITR